MDGCTWMAVHGWLQGYEINTVSLTDMDRFMSSREIVTLP